MGDAALSMDVFENSEQKSEALVHVLKQVCSRNKATEKKDLWDQKRREDKGSATSISLKSNTGVIKNIAVIPKGAEVTANSVNKYEEERKRNTEQKEDVNLRRFCNGKDNAWRPDSFFTEACGEDEVPPWPVRPGEIFSNPALCMRIMAHQLEQKEKRKLEKRKNKAEDTGKKQKKKKRKKGKTSKKDAKAKGKKKKDKGRKKEKSKDKDKKVGRKRKQESSSESGSDVEASRSGVSSSVQGGSDASSASASEVEGDTDQ